MTTRRLYDPDHCTACGDFLPCGDSWIKDADNLPDGPRSSVGRYRRLEARAVELVTERDMVLRMHAVQLERANRLEVERDEHQWNALEMAREASLATARAEAAEAEVERLLDDRECGRCSECQRGQSCTGIER